MNRAVSTISLIEEGQFKIGNSFSTFIHSTIYQVHMHVYNTTFLTRNLKRPTHFMTVESLGGRFGAF